MVQFKGYRKKEVIELLLKKHKLEDPRHNKKKYILPFGKYKGQKFQDVPEWYREW